MLTSLLNRLECWLFEPPDSLVGKPVWLVTRLLRFPYALIRDVIGGELTLRAMSLVYTTLLSVVPLIALMFSVLKGLGFHRELEPLLYTFLEPLGDKAYDLTAQIMQFVDNVRGGVLGSTALIFLLYTVLSMVQKVEESFNFVWRVEQPRSLGRRFSEYLSVMIIGPTVIVAAIGLMAALRESSIVRLVVQYEPFGTILLMIGRLTPYLMVIGVFTFLYAFIPNTRVRFTAAAVGGIAGGLAWATAGVVFTSFVAGSTNTTVIYAGFAIVIVALIWLHLSWLILLLGVQLAFYVQNPQYLRPGRGEIRLNASLSERVALSLMYLIVQDYQNSAQRWTTNRLAEHLDVPGAGLGPIVTALEKKGLLIIADDDTWLPARDPAMIQLAEVIDAVRTNDAGPRLSRIRDIAPAVNAAKRAENALKESLEDKTVGDLVRETQESAAALPKQ